MAGIKDDDYHDHRYQLIAGRWLSLLDFPLMCVDPGLDVDKSPSFQIVRLQPGRGSIHAAAAPEPP